MKIGFIHKHSEYQKEINYVLSFLNTHPLVQKANVEFIREPANVNIYYGVESISFQEFRMPSQGFFFSNEIVRSPKCNIYTNDSKKIYSVEPQKKDSEKRFIEDGRFGFDIIESLFFYLSRYEEYHALDTEKDEWDMYQSERHFFIKNGIEKKPVVDNLIATFLDVLGINTQIHTRFAMTHDIDVLLKLDTVYKLIRSVGAGIKHQRGLTYLRNQISGYIRNDDPYDVYEWMLTNDSVFSEKVVYFLAGGRSRHDRPYSLTSRFFKKLIKKAIEKGYKIGVHPSFETWRNTDYYQKEVMALERVTGNKISDSRQHFLRYDFSKTAEIINESNIESDSSLGYQDRIGFRSGTGFAYKLWNFEERKPCRFWSLPLVVMDVALGREPYKNQLKSFIITNQTNTQITFNFHNSTFDRTTPSGRAWKKYYLELIDFLNTLRS